jgi:hypothetical protein
MQVGAGMKALTFVGRLQRKSQVTKGALVRQQSQDATRKMIRQRNRAKTSVSLMDSVSKSLKIDVATSNLEAALRGEIPVLEMQAALISARKVGTPELIRLSNEVEARLLLLNPGLSQKRAAQNAPEVQRIVRLIWGACVITRPCSLLVG